MAKEKTQNPQAETPEEPETEPAVQETDEAPGTDAALAQLQAQLAAEQDKYLRLLAEYDNFRKRSQKEKDQLYTESRAEIVGKFLPVYDNLERALNQPTADEAYKKGVEMTMGGLMEVLEKLGVERFGDAGDSFDPNMHNAVMHCEDEALGENVLAEVFQKGFRVGERVIRFAMVRVAN
ncbi:MAG: nucleotide exchange factor GrpE [Oscillospiraceae bacterium]|nr:nucleotide exchange factor GrpE [Oscillospiraceae bacterium]